MYCFSKRIQLFVLQLHTIIPTTANRVETQLQLINITYHIIYHLYRIISYRIVSHRIVSYRIVSYIISYYIISYIMSCHVISYLIVSYHIIAYRTVSYRTVSYRTVSYRTISYIITRFRTRLASWGIQSLSHS